jgi:hypothetical protein
MVADPVRKLHTGIRQDRRQLMGRADRDERIARASDQQHRLHHVRQRRGQVAEPVHQRPLLGQETAPQRPVIVTGVAPRCAS